MPIPSKPNDPLSSLQKVDLTGLYLVDDRHDSIRTGQLVYRDGDYVMVLLDPVQDMPERMILLTMEQLTETHQECGCPRWSLFPTAAARDEWMRAFAFRAGSPERPGPPWEGRAPASAAQWQVRARGAAA